MDSKESTPPPASTSLLGRICGSTLISIVVPTVAYYVLRSIEVAQFPALIICALLPLLHMFGHYIRHRSVELFQVFTLIIVLCSMALSMIQGSPRFLLATDGILLTGLAIANLLSLAADKTLPYHLTLSTLRGTKYGDKINIDAWDRAWDRNEENRRAWRVITIAGAATDLFFAVTRVLFAFLLPIDVVPILGGIIALITIPGVWVIAISYLRKKGAWDYAYERAEQPDHEIDTATASDMERPPVAIQDN
jgi:hypothetical protein